MFRRIIVFAFLIHIWTGSVRFLFASSISDEDERNLDILIKKLKESETLNKKNIQDNNNFINYKHIIEESMLYKIIKEMPKGGSLDGHLFGLVSHEYIYSLTYSNDLFIYFKEDGSIKFSYENYSHNDDQWHHLSTLRRTKKISEEFLKGQLSLRSFSTIGDSSLFQKKVSMIFNTIKSLFSKVSVLKDAIYQMLKEHYEDNIMYVEFRYSLDFYDSKADRKYEPEKILRICHKVIKKFKSKNPDFMDAKMIYSPMKNKHFIDNFDILMGLIKIYPNFVVGCDIYPEITMDIINQAKAAPREVQFFLHFGDDVQFPEHTNLNLVTSIINRPSRYIYRNGILTNKRFVAHIKSLGVGISICPLSIMKRTPLSLQNEPIMDFINKGYHVMACNEFSNFWEAYGLSYDWYMLFLFMTNDSIGLPFLKQTALNSLIYSGLGEIESMVAVTQWTEMWIKFVKKAQHYIVPKNNSNVNSTLLH